MTEQSVAEQPSGDGQALKSDWMIEANGLTKHYGNFSAAEDVTFTVPKGQVAAFLGPNGAGKSTTMKMLTGYLTPTDGSAVVGGIEVSEDRIGAARLIGYLPENGPLYDEMTPRSLLKYCGHARGMDSSLFTTRFDYVVEVCALSSVLDKSISKLSKGYRQRVGMAQAILHDPQVLILDEPSSGLDPNQTHQCRDLIRELGREKTVLLSTHILSEVAAVCHRVILIRSGKIILDGSISDLGDTAESMEEQFRKLTA